MAQQRETQPSLPVRRAFVVQFRAEADLQQGRFVGRVEHVVSGHSARFSSLAELLAFVARELRATPGPSGEPPPDENPT